jgi:hypothetical protein
MSGLHMQPQDGPTNIELVFLSDDLGHSFSVGVRNYRLDESFRPVIDGIANDPELASFLAGRTQGGRADRAGRRAFATVNLRTMQATID